MIFQGILRKTIYLYENQKSSIMTFKPSFQIRNFKDCVFVNSISYLVSKKLFKIAVIKISDNKIKAEIN